MPQLENQVVVITGASSGIGASLAELLGARGAKVALLARREKELSLVARRALANALPLVTDVTSRPRVEEAARRVIAHYGHVDVWVNNAGRGITRLVSELTDDDFDEMMRVNVKSALYAMQTILPHFRERKRGHIINVSSMLGRVPQAPFRSAYSAAKHALNALTANLRLELKEQYPEIYVSTVSPGVVATDFGLQALHGGVDSKTLPGAQPAREVAEVIASVIEAPRADVYTREGARESVVAYFAAEDMAQVEHNPFGSVRG
jgi:NAD(P)-dependent dehydrogenase (short-subunit alcohol dehydrogenase family)